MLTSLLLKAARLIRVWNAGLGQSSAEKSRTPSSRKVRYVYSCKRIRSIHTKPICFEYTCVVQVETGDTGFAADGNASASGL